MYKAYYKWDDCWLVNKDTRTAIETTKEHNLPWLWIRHDMSERHATGILEIYNEYTEWEMQDWHKKKLIDNWYVKYAMVDIKDWDDTWVYVWEIANKMANYIGDIGLMCVDKNMEHTQKYLWAFYNEIQLLF